MTVIAAEIAQGAERRRVARLIATGSLVFALLIASVAAVLAVAA